MRAVVEYEGGGCGRWSNMRADVQVAREFIACLLGRCASDIAYYANAYGFSGCPCAFGLR